MEAVKKYTLGIIFSGFLFLLIVPFIQNQFSLINVGKLEGAFIPKIKPVFNSADWFSGKYQKEAEVYFNETFGFRNLLVRLNNQIAFSFFNKANADNIVVGRNNYLFQRPTINAYYGMDFLGVDRIKERTKKLKFISDTLSKLNKNLIIIFGTGKASYFPEFIPEKLKVKKGTSNLECQSEFFGKYGLNYIDFNKYFIDNKYSSKYPLVPQYGIHWSRYGGFLVTDSLLHYIESIRNIDLPDIVLDSIEWRRPENEDYDIAGGMNLLFRLESFPMAYPKFHYESDSGKAKPSVLVIGDSYYWGMQNMEISKAFSKNQFWFYNNRGTAGALKELALETKLSMAQEINNFDIVILIATESNMPQLGWGFIENTYSYYKGIPITEGDQINFQDDVAYFKDKIKRDKSKMERITEMAKRNNISVDSMLTLRATIRANSIRNNIKKDGI
jgi:hypothetical protein